MQAGDQQERWVSCSDKRIYLCSGYLSKKSQSQKGLVCKRVGKVVKRSKVEKKKELLSMIERSRRWKRKKSKRKEVSNGTGRKKFSSQTREGNLPLGHRVDCRGGFSGLEDSFPKVKKKHVHQRKEMGGEVMHGREKGKKIEPRIAELDNRWLSLKRACPERKNV